MVTKDKFARWFDKKMYNEIPIYFTFTLVYVRESFVDIMLEYSLNVITDWWRNIIMKIVFYIFIKTNADFGDD